MPLLYAENVVVCYGRIEILHGVEIELHEGEVVCVLGPNGAGKSTLFRAISGLKRVDGGDIWMDGTSIKNKPPHAIVHRGLGQVAEGRQLFPNLSVLDHLLLAARYGNRRRGRNVDDLCQRVFSLFPKLDERRQSKAGTLSGGQQQMLAVAQALMVDPRLLLLDEPSLGLAPLVVREIMDVLVRLQHDGMAVLLIEQNAMIGLRIAGRAYVLEGGSIQFEGPSARLLADEALKQHYLGSTGGHCSPALEK